MDTTNPVEVSTDTAQVTSSQSTRLLAQRSANPNTPEEPNETSSRFYASAQWTADGTTILVGSSDYSVSSFILPDDLLQPTEDGKPRELTPLATTKLPEPTQVIASAPYFSLPSPASHHFLVGCRDHPIQLYPVFPVDGSSKPSHSYKLIRQETEGYITPSSLIWPYPGTHFVCGSANRIDYFDVTRPGSEGPLVTMPTIPSKRHISKGSGVGMRGTVSALAATQPDAVAGCVIAAGTWTRWVGLYDFLRTDNVVANWSIADAGKTDYQVDLGGQGVVQTMWSPCGRYLLINERQANGLLVYDIRGTSKLLGILNGRTATSQQKLTCDVFSGGDGIAGFEVWAGSEDGSLVVWNEVGMSEGITEPSQTRDAHTSPIGSAIVHSSGSVAATCSGGWVHSGGSRSTEEFDDSPAESYGTRLCGESSLKIWAIEDVQPSAP